MKTELGPIDSICSATSGRTSNGIVLIGAKADRVPMAASTRNHAPTTSTLARDLARRRHLDQREEAAEIVARITAVSLRYSPWTTGRVPYLRAGIARTMSIADDVGFPRIFFAVSSPFSFWTGQNESGDPQQFAPAELLGLGRWSAGGPW